MDKMDETEEIYTNNITKKQYTIIKNNGSTPNSDGEFVNVLKSTTPNTDTPNTDTPNIVVTNNELASGYTKKLVPKVPEVVGGRRKRRSQKNKSKRKRGRKSYRRRR